MMQKLYSLPPAPAPEQVVEECIDWLRDRFGATIEPRSIREESVSFPLPRELRNIAPASPPFMPVSEPTDAV